MPKCSYCAEFKKDFDNSYYLKNISSQVGSSRIRLESENFYVYPSVGALVVGHLLVVPKKHYTALSLASENELAELSEIVADIKVLQEQMFGHIAHIFMFEHGILDIEKTMMNCVDHAHLHVLPFSIDVVNLPFSKYSKLKLIDLAGHKIDEPDYIFYGMLDCSFLSLDKDKHPQYLRKVLHEKLSLSGHWNWRTDPGIENIKAWLGCFSDLIDKHCFQSLNLTRLKLID